VNRTPAGITNLSQPSLIGDYCRPGYVAKLVAMTLNAFSINTQADS